MLCISIIFKNRVLVGGCCGGGTIEVLQEKQRKTLKIVLFINIVMFFVIAIASQIGKSSALFADSLDDLGDALTYGLSLMVVASSVRAKAKVALFKGALIFLASMAVAGQIAYRFINPAMPIFEYMGIFSILALMANSLCLFLLWQHRHDDINMSSVWECSRNDIATNLSVFIAAGAVWLTDSRYPDVVVGIGLVILLFRSSIRAISSSIIELKGGDAVMPSCKH